MRKIRGLAQVCSSDISKLAKCVVGGRDHLPCCQRRGVPSQCQVGGTYFVLSATDTIEDVASVFFVRQV